MKYAIVLAFGAAAFAQNITQSASQSCPSVGVVTETSYTYITYCPPCTSSSTSLTSSSASSASSASGSLTSVSSSFTSSTSATTTVAVGSNSNDGPIFQSTTDFGSTSVGTPITTSSVSSTASSGGSSASASSTSGSAQGTSSSGAASSGTSAATTTSAASTTAATTVAQSSSGTTSSAPPYDTSTVPDPTLSRTGQVQNRPLSSIPNYNDYAQAILYAHNLHRKNASIPLLSWNQQLADYAQQTANTCVYAHSSAAGSAAGSPNTPYGQNIGAGFVYDSSQGINQVPAMITNNMYDQEINNYPGPYGSNNVDTSNFGGWGHYSQLVWTSTTSVGCYTAYCPNGLANTGPNTPPYFTVCDYYPAGNYVGQWSQVAAPGGADTVVFTS